MNAIIEIPAAKSKPRADYLALVERFPLRAISSDRDYDAAVSVLDKLIGHDLTKGQEEYMDALATLIERYDDVHHPMPDDPRSPLERLRSLMETSGTTPGKLGDIIGSRPAASMVLAGDRELSKAQIRKLAAHFKIEAGYFL